MHLKEFPQVCEMCGYQDNEDLEAPRTLLDEETKLCVECWEKEEVEFYQNEDKGEK